MSSEDVLCVSWASHTNAIFDGLSTLQQNEEFVDMTLVAEGHLVKVHKNIVALASPYIKAMIQSASCPHPVVFLNKMSKDTLTYILDYVYTGEAKIPVHDVSIFVETCKELAIKGFEITSFISQPKTELLTEAKAEETWDNNAQNSQYAAQITIDPQCLNVQVNPIIPVDNINNDHCYQATGYHDIPTTNNNANIQNNIVDQQETTDTKRQDPNNTSIPMPVDIKVLSNSTFQYLISQTCDLSAETRIDSMECESGEQEDSSIQTITLKNPKDTVNQAYYSISNRGALLLLLNRHMYYCHHMAGRGKKRRWRCVDYRRTHCPAFIDTLDEVIVRKTEDHHHNYHDKKIQQKIKANIIYSTLPNIISKSKEIIKRKKLDSKLKKKETLSERRRNKANDEDIVMDYLVKFNTEKSNADVL